MELSSFQCFIGQESHIKCMKYWNEDSSIVMLSYTFYIGLLVQLNTGMKTAPKCIRQYHNGAVFIPVFHWTRIQYKMYKTASQWRCLHSSVSSFYIGLLVQWNTGMMTAPLWCCLRHFIWDSCPMKHWNEDSSIVMLSYTFYIGFLSNETLE
jgi:hypothetical protein